MSSQGRADSAESVFPDTNPSRQHYGKDYYPFEENLKGLVAVINNFTDEEDPRYRLGESWLHMQSMSGCFGEVLSLSSGG